MPMPVLKICFRTKGNHKQGMGDVTGSLALAEEFKSRDCQVSFLIDPDTETVDLIKTSDYEFHLIAKNSTDALDNLIFDIVIVNQLNTSSEELSWLKGHGRKLVTIDDVGEPSRRLADLRINPLYFDEDALCDIRYIPLHAVFGRAHRQAKTINPRIANILVTMGGSDTYGFTPQILGALSDIDAYVTVILGSAFKHYEELKKVIAQSKRSFEIRNSIDIETMCQCIEEADLAICGAGNTLFEMACCGTPVIVICNEPFEEETAYRLEQKGFGRVIPFNETLDQIKLKDFLRQYETKEIRETQSKTGMSLIDGMGTKSSVDKILEPLPTSVL